MDQTLKERLSVDAWVDIDVAAFFLARSLGVMGPEIPSMASAKGVFWTVNKDGDALFNMLEEMVKMGALLECENDNTLVKWNPLYKGSWEK